MILMGSFGEMNLRVRASLKCHNRNKFAAYTILHVSKRKVLSM